MKVVRYLLLGALCFAISQIFIRIPLLNRLIEESRFIIFYQNNILFTGFLIALSVGVFEEGGRFFFKKILIGPKESAALEPFLFGLGHGLCEAIYLLGPFVFVYPLTMLLPAIFERLIAIVLHISFSFIIWNGFQKTSPSNT